MSHLTEPLLNEYLDDALDPSTCRSVESHLEGCAACREKLAALRSVFQIVETIAEEPLLHDLTPSIWKTLTRGSNGLVWKLVLAVQAGFVTGLLILIAPLLTSQLAESIRGVAEQAVATVVIIMPRSISFNPALPAIALPHIPVLRFPFPLIASDSNLWLVLGIASFLLFIIGNISLIFRKAPGARK